MIGLLPKSLDVNGVSYPINSDFRVALIIFEAFNDPDLSDVEKYLVCIRCLYDDYTKIPKSDYTEAYKKASWFLDGGNVQKEDGNNSKLLDWEQDESILFPALNKAAGYEIRAVPYLHWWTFLGYFGELSEGLFSTILSIRLKKSKGKKLDKHELEFYRNNKKLVDIKKKYSAEEQAEIDKLNALLG